MSVFEILGGGGSGSGGSGTVTSVALATGAGAADVLYTISGSPVTTSGTITETLNTQSAHTVLAGPTSGGAVSPTFRALVAGDLPAGTGTVTSIAFATGGGASDALYTISGSPVTTSGTITETLKTQTANTFFAGPTSGGAVTPTWRAIGSTDIPAGTVTWDAIGNAAGSLTLANGTNATTFNQTSAAAWTWANTTTATVATTNASPVVTLDANYWTGAASAVDAWTLSSALAAGTNGASTCKLTHSGSTGTALFALGDSTHLVGLQLNDGAGHTTTLTPTASGIGFVNSTGATTIGAASGFTVTGSGGSSISLAANVGFNANSGAGQGFTFNKPFLQYNGISLVDNGVASEVAHVDATAQAASISATTLYTPAATGRFRISAYLKVTQAATASSTLGGVTITFTDGTDSVAQSIVMGLNDQTGAHNTTNTGNSTTSNLNGDIFIYAKTGVAIQYAVAYTSSGATAMQYEVHLTCEAM